MRTLTGITPSGTLHVGNYFGAMRPAIEAQAQGDCFYFIADYHSMTSVTDPHERRANTRGIAVDWLACGLDPGRCTLFVQSHVHEHAELAWLLECTASMGELARMTQFKDKTGKGGEEAARLGFFAYPVLMAADILLYDADLVPVGDDQRQHLELTRDLAQRWNARYGETFTIPEAAIAPAGGGARIMDLQDPVHKMSKSSGSDAGLIFLLDDPKVIERKVKRAVTDLDPPGPGAVRWGPLAKPGVSNLLELLAALKGGKPEEIAAGYENYGRLKADVAEAVIETLRPLQDRYRELAEDPAAVQMVLADGAARASEVASVTLGRARAAIGLLAP